MSPAAAALYQRKNDLKDIDSNQVNKANVDDDNKRLTQQQLPQSC